MNEEYQRYLREAFKELLKEKTGWGRNDVLSLFDRASSVAAMKVLDSVKSNRRTEG